MIVRIRPPLDLEKTLEILALSSQPDGHAVKMFEKGFAARVNAARAIAVDRGRSALLLGLKILGIKKGDEVIVQSYIFHAVIDAILEVGAHPVLADSSLGDFNIAPESIENAITGRTKAILVTHLGVPCDMEQISAIAGKHNCRLIENCAHTFGAECNGMVAGKFGDISFYSLDVDKPFSTGDGGILVINNPDFIQNANDLLEKYRRVPLPQEEETVCGLVLHYLATSAKFYPQEGFLPVDFGKNAVKKDKRLLSVIKNGEIDKFDAHILPHLQKIQSSPKKTSWLSNKISNALGIARMALEKTPLLPKIDTPYLLMNSLRSSVGAACLKDYDAIKNIRDRNANYYIDNLKTAAFKHPEIAPHKKTAFIRYAVLNETKYDNSWIRARAGEQGFEIGIFNWSAPVHLCYPYNKLLDFDRAKLQNSEQLGRKLLSLPVHPYLEEESLAKITRFLNGLAH